MASQQRQHILFVEDDADTLTVTTAMLERLGYSVRAETESLKALKAFSEEPDRFDLALLDHGMADITGLELAHRFRRIRPSFPVVVYTGYLETPSAEQLEAAAIGGWVLFKPATLGELADVIQKALKGRAMVCDKCGFRYMVDDSYEDIKVLKCPVCGDRIYAGHPKRRGALVCSQCGGDLDEENELSLCGDCLKLLGIHVGQLKGRTYGETICPCGTTFIRKSPTQLFHSRQCRERMIAHP